MEAGSEEESEIGTTCSGDRRAEREAGVCEQPGEAALGADDGELC